MAVIWEWVPGIPGWLLEGLIIGSVGSALVTIIFVMGARLFPDTPVSASAPGPDRGERKRRAEIRYYLRAINEPFVEDYSIGEWRVAFYLPDRNVAITFNARDFFLLESTDVYPILVEHEMPGSHLAGRLPFETPHLDTMGLMEHSTVETAFDILGIPVTSSIREVRSAYRERIKAAHPDHGGDPELFKQVREAYTIAKKRAG